MGEKKRYVYACRVIPQEERDVAHAHGENAVELDGGAAGVGDVRQVAVDLDERGVEAYLGASNLMPGELEPVVKASIDGWAETALPTASPAVHTAGVRVPHDEDTRYQESLFLREGKRGAGVKVAVIDTGLGGPIYQSWLREYVVAGKSWVGGNYYSSAQDHGTHVATTALQDNSRLIHCAALGNDGSGTSDGIVAAIYWAAQQGADIINMSLSGPAGGTTYERAIAAARDAGALVFCAAGNAALEGNPVRYPAACPSAIAVAAYDRDTDRRAPFSSHHAYVDLAGSGVNVLAYGRDGGLMRMSGTSMATPMVAWTAAGLAAAHGARGSKLGRALRGGARKNGSPQTHYGHGVCSGAGSWQLL